jgi:hypothetical protein
MTQAVTLEEMIAAVKAHARKNYNKGWDVIVECYSDSEIAAEIAAEIKGAKTTKGAINKVAKGLNIYNSYADDIRGA